MAHRSIGTCVSDGECAFCLVALLLSLCWIVSLLALGDIFMGRGDLQR